MAVMTTHFSRKLHMAFAAMLLITLALAWYFYDSVKWFEYDVKRITIANSVLNGYRSLSAYANDKLRLIEDSARQGEITDLSRWRDLDSNMRTTVGNIRQSLLEEHELQGVGHGNEDLANLDELRAIVEQVIRSGETIRQALESGQTAVARAEVVTLGNKGTKEFFNELASQTLEDRIKALSDANTEAISLAHYITGVLPLFMMALAGFTALIAWLFSRGLTRSVNSLYYGAQSFTSGDLNHRIPQLQEKEFNRLGAAFNTMARQLAEHRAEMHDSNVRLEAIVEERTRALKDSNEVLAAVDENRRKLLADISHEFRTPLTVIRGEAEIALRGKTRTRAEYQETLARIMEQADATTRLVDDLLFIARADAGEPRLKIRPLSIGSVLGAVCDDFEARASQRNIRIKRNLTDNMTTVMGDDGRLRQVFSILIDNALRYSDDDSLVEIELERTAKEVVIRVRDNGIGLTESEARQAFQRFFRGGKAQGHARGTGLGLPVAKAIVEAHKGSITLQGRPGDGALAQVVLPAEDQLKSVA